MTGLRNEPEPYESQIRGVPEAQIAIRVRVRTLESQIRGVPEAQIAIRVRVRTL
jgi:hypothetical protein